MMIPPLPRDQTRKMTKLVFAGACRAQRKRSASEEDDERGQLCSVFTAMFPIQLAFGSTIFAVDCPWGISTTPRRALMLPHVFLVGLVERHWCAAFYGQVFKRAVSPAKGAGHCASIWIPAFVFPCIYSDEVDERGFFSVYLCLMASTTQNSSPPVAPVSSWQGAAIDDV
eukprot:361432-Chlamydomonas_euryale.AAC.11